MKKISDVLTENLFLNAYNICKGYTKKQNITDINLLLLKNSFNSITENNIRKYYEKYIKTELFYSVPLLFTTDIVEIPKNINGLREYRFFTMMSMILYNSIGLLFVDICNDFINKVNFKKDNIYHFSPTNFKYNVDKNEWSSENEYSKQYKKFTNTMDQIIEKGDIILKIDIKNYFDNINHIKLVNLLKEMGLESRLAIYDIDEKAIETLLFYFESLMGQNKGIPQGKINCVSDLFGLLYLLPLDFNIVNICKKYKIKYKAMIRYVDDMIIVFKNENNLENKEIFKELSKIEQELSLFLNDNLKIKINEKKTNYKIISNDQIRENFIIENTKNVSNSNKINNENNENLDIKINNLLEVIKKYKFSSNNNFRFYFDNFDKEILKVIFDERVKNYLKSSRVKNKVRKVLESIDIELTVGEINILIVLFLLKNKNKNLYMDILLKQLIDNMNLKDKRIIHIILLLISQNINFDEEENFKKMLKENKESLLEDNYGKYILILKQIYNNNDKINILTNEGIFNQINYEYNKKAKFSKKIIYPNVTMYSKLIEILEIQENIDESIINQLKWYVYNIKNGNLDSAFNHFFNVFHEICKEKFNLKDNDSVDTVINSLYNEDIINNKDEIVIRKFYDRRNFNPVSHPSKNGKASVKISYKILEEFEDDIIKIILKIFDN